MIASNRAHHVLIGGSVDFTISFIDATQEGQHVIITNNTLYKGFLVPINIQPGTTVELIYSISAWKLIGTNEPTSTTAWSRSGNGGTIDYVNNYIGTTDAKPVRFIENGGPAGLLDAARGSYFFGGGAGFNTLPGTTGNSGFGNLTLFKTTTGSNNTAIGSHSLFSNLQGSNNTALGVLALHKDTAANEAVAIGAEALHWNQARFGNTAVGAKALYWNTFTNTSPILASQGLNNTALGYSALLNNRRGSSNVAVGFNSLSNDTTGFENTAIGAGAMQNSRNGYNNIGIGFGAFKNHFLSSLNISIGRASLENGNLTKNNIAIGDSAMSSISIPLYYVSENIAIGTSTLKKVNSDYNIAIGYKALSDSVGGDNVALGANALNRTIGIQNYLFGPPATGSNNVALGSNAGRNNTTGVNNVFLGTGAGGNAQSSNKLYIDNKPIYAFSDSLNALIYGDFEADSLLLNAKTVVRNNAVVRGFTKLGGYGSDVPAIKTKKITGTGPAVNGNMPVPHGLSADKIISVQIFMQYGASPTPTKVLPPGYTLLAGFEYQFEIDGANILITNKGANSANIGSKPYRMLITYEE
jgi:trimeric autotransporter adhesin